ncbi:hypothetical protein PSENEW3_00000222 [Picochlorum sp. SENEW3]|nr:hypothetical protein PSENEW3_00000222 [Picochlorum sp. SENEW3]
MNFCIESLPGRTRVTTTSGRGDCCLQKNKSRREDSRSILFARHSPAQHHDHSGINSVTWWRCSSGTRDDEHGDAQQEHGTDRLQEYKDEEESFPTTVTSSPDMRAGTSTGLVKATFEPYVLEKHNAGVMQKLRDAPWEFGYHVNERNVYWNDELQSRLYSKVASEELGMSEETLDMYLTQLRFLMPDACDKMKNMSVGTLADLVKHIDDIPHRLMVLKNVFPNANACLLGIRNPQVLLHVEESTLQSMADELHEMFPNLDVDRLVEENPSMLDIQGIKNAIAEAKQIMPSLDIQHAMGSDPQLILGFQRGSDMISGGFD